MHQSPPQLFQRYLVTAACLWFYRLPNSEEAEDAEPEDVIVADARSGGWVRHAATALWLPAAFLDPDEQMDAEYQVLLAHMLENRPTGGEDNH